MKEHHQRKVAAGLFHSIDGVVEAPDRWQFDSFGAELGALLGGVMAKTGAASSTNSHLITHPVIAGSGRHLFEPADPTTRLVLTDCVRTSRGNVVTTYARL
jgi:hypothetical protein